MEEIIEMAKMSMDAAIEHLQQELVKVLGTFTPKIVRMDK